jgi:hypothetical protein
MAGASGTSDGRGEVGTMIDLKRKENNLLPTDFKKPHLNTQMQFSANVRDQ